MADFQSRSSGERALGQTFGDFVAGVSYSISFGTKGIALDAQVAVLGLSAKAGYSTSSLTTFGNLSAYVGVGEVFGTGAYGQKGFAGIGLSTRDGPVAQARP